MTAFNEDIFDGLETGAGIPDEVNTPKEPTIIKVVGVGGGGSNAVNHMYNQNIEGVSFVVVNTDRQALNGSPVPNRLLIGPETCHGLGAGNNPDRAREASEESAEEIAKLFDDGTQMVFITAGMGGGTGTGAAPIVARIAREKGVLTIGIVTIPFIFEGRNKIIKALNGADEMSKYVDALLVINNERLTEIYPDLDFINAFGKADDTLATAAHSISELITAEGQINLDFMDVNTTLRDGGVAIISSGYGEGDHRVTKAINNALESPLLKNRDVYGSTRILMNVYFNRNSDVPFKMEEMKELNEFMTNFNQNVDVIWGVAYDDTLGDQVKLTILAAGFEVSYTDEAGQEPKSTLKGAQPATAQASTKKSQEDKENEERLKKVYGSEKIAEQNREFYKARYAVLTPQDIDNDDLVDLFERTPTFKRDTQFKTRIHELQQGIEAPKDDATKPAQSQGGTSTINFG